MTSAAIGYFSSIVGIITSSLGLVNFGKSEFPFANDNHCGVRIAVGLDAAVNPHTLGGNWPDIRFFNENGEAIGQQYDLKKEEDDLMDSPVKLKGGESYDSVIKLDHAQQPTYGLFNGNKDAICIGYISVTWPDTQEFAWLGSWGKQCGQPWYYSGLFFEEADPVCTWLDEDGTATDVMGFQVHFPEFKADSNGKYKKDIDYYCTNAAVMSFNTHENHNITYWTHEEEQAEAAEAFYSDRRRSVNGSHAGGHRSKFRPNEKTASALGQSLTKSNRTSHSAYEICGSDTSVGPDFLHIDEGQFCDMKTKTLWPVCTAENEKNCFDAEIHDMRLYKSVGKREVPDNAMAKNYSRFELWL